MKRTTNHQLTMFFGITFIFSWILWIPAVIKSNGFANLPDIVGLPGMFAQFGPALAAIWLTWRESGKAGAKQLWLRGWRLDFAKKWLIPTLLLGPIAALLAAALILLAGGAIAWEHGVPLLATVPIFLLIYFTQALPEEYGWRGFALDPLQSRFNALPASLILGAIWALWHLPLFFIEGTTQQAIPLYEFVLQTMVLAIFYTWLYNNTGGSVLIAALFHGVSNTATAAVPFWTTELGRWLDFGVLVVLAGTIIWYWGWRRLARNGRTPHKNCQ
jgi:membrane protease YdiL (CAAX protease family)